MPLGRNATDIVGHGWASVKGVTGATGIVEDHASGDEADRVVGEASLALWAEWLPRPPGTRMGTVGTGDGAGVGVDGA